MIFSKDPRNYWFMNLIVIAFFMVLVLLYKSQDLTPYFEGFMQNKPFIYKNNLDAYDEFYTEIYDQLQVPEQRNIFVLDKTIEMTKPSLQNSVFLEIEHNSKTKKNNQAQIKKHTTIKRKSKAHMQYMR